MNTLYVQSAIHSAQVDGKRVVLVTPDDNHLRLLKEVSGFVGPEAESTGTIWKFKSGGVLRVSPVGGSIPTSPYLLAPHSFKGQEYGKLQKWRENSIGELRWD